MKTFMLLLRVMFFVIVVFLLINLGIRLLHLGVKFWYIPALILVYFLVSQALKKKKEKSNFFHSSVDPHKEVKPDKEPEVTDIEDNDNQDSPDSSGSSAK